MTDESPSLWTLIREDYNANGRDFFRPGFRALACYRFGVWRMQCRRRAVRILLGVVYRLMYRKCAYVYGIEIPYTASIGRRVTIEHQHGIVVHGETRIGDECVLRQGVTLGMRSEDEPYRAPSLGCAVSVGSGAKILGAVQIGDNAKIGANAVVLHDVPAGAVAVGIPARVVMAAHPSNDGVPESVAENATEVMT